MRNWSIVLIILIFAGIVYGYNNPSILSSISNKISIPTASYDSIEDIAKNCEKYNGRQVYVRGTLYYTMGLDYQLHDDKGYWIWVDTPSYRNLDQGKVYTLNGTLSPDSYDRSQCRLAVS